MNTWIFIVKNIAYKYKIYDQIITKAKIEVKPFKKL